MKDFESCLLHHNYRKYFMALNTKKYIETHQDRFLDELMDFLRIPSVSTSKEYAAEVRRAAEFVRQKLLEAGTDEARLIDTQGHPLVYAEKMIDASLPTVLVYGHYDVQPVDPYALWETSPFEPVVKEEKIYARGASDDKGQVYLHIKALETMLTTQQLPCNIKFLIEGEEESGSEGLTNFLENQKNAALLQSDAVLVSDTTLLSLEQPSLTTGLRGLVYLEIEVTGPNRDLHSGIYGGAVGNPINILCQMIAALHDEHHRITIPGFYDHVAVLSKQDRQALSNIPFILSDYQNSLGIKAVAGEQGYSTLERAGIRPALDINGIWGGYVGEGGKTVLPSKAHAKLSMRLVPHQEAQKIITQFTNYFTALAPKGVAVKVRVVHAGSNAVVVNADSRALQAAKKAFEEVWNRTPLLTKDGGSIPIITRFKEVLDCDIVLMGFGLDSDAIHSPNEHFGVINFFKGINTVIAFYKYLAALHT
jgi:acetylornithine deacetylase/succinyl-diaminopimelate desuccinylase-like protein